MNFEAQIYEPKTVQTCESQSHTSNIYILSFSPNKIMNLEPLKSIDSKAQKSRILKDLIAFTLKNRGPKPQKHVSLKP